MCGKVCRQVAVCSSRCVLKSLFAYAVRPSLAPRSTHRNGIPPCVIKAGMLSEMGRSAPPKRWLSSKLARQGPSLARLARDRWFGRKFLENVRKWLLTAVGAPPISAQSQRRLGAGGVLSSSIRLASGRRLSEETCFRWIPAAAFFDKWELKEKRRRRGSAVALGDHEIPAASRLRAHMGSASC